MPAMTATMQSTGAIFGTLRENAPEVDSLTNTVEWKTSAFSAASRTPDELETINLPGVSDPAQYVAASALQPSGAIDREELKDWYRSQNLHDMKYTVDEWKHCRDFVKTSSKKRRSLSNKTLNSSTRNRTRIAHHLDKKSNEVSVKFEKRLGDIKAAHGALTDCFRACEKEVLTVQERVASAKEFVTNRFDWPIKVNQACLNMREERIGIDKILDLFEIELMKEKDMLLKMSTHTIHHATDEFADNLVEMVMWGNRLAADISKKEAALNIDTKMARLTVSSGLQLHLDSVEIKPPTGVEVAQWRESSGALMEHTYQAVADSARLRKKLAKTLQNADQTATRYGKACDAALAKARKRAAHTRGDIAKLLAETKKEIQITEKEIVELDRLVALQETPLKLVTTQLQVRSQRPEGEATNDEVHTSLLEEVADLDNAVSALTKELNIHIQNLDQLRTLEAMLEEDFAIKKNTVMLENRCGKARSFLSADTDTFLINKMLNDDKFFDVMTR